jgi:hypothetical protein
LGWHQISKDLMNYKNNCRLIFSTQSGSESSAFGAENGYPAAITVQVKTEVDDSLGMPYSLLYLMKHILLLQIILDSNQISQNALTSFH